MVPGTIAIWRFGSNALSTDGSIGPDRGSFNGMTSGVQVFPVRLSVMAKLFWASAESAKPRTATPLNRAVAPRKIGLMTVLRSHALVMTFPAAHLGLGLFLADAVTRLDLADELLATALDLHQVVVTKLAPLLLHRTLRLGPASLDLFPDRGGVVTRGGRGRGGRLRLRHNGQSAERGNRTSGQDRD